MNVLFIYSLLDCGSVSKPIIAQEKIYLGISYISSFLKKHGHQTKLFVLTRETKHSMLFEYIRDFNPQLICFTAVATEYPFIVNTAKAIKVNFPKLFLLIGGVHVSLNPSEAILDTFDAFCLGEGELPTFELVKQIESGIVPSKIANLWIKHGDMIEKNLSRPYMDDIDILPFPDREMWQEWINYKDSRVSVLLGRGCPYNCTYCCNHALKKVSTGKYVRFRSHDNVIAEIKEIVDKFPKINEIYLEVETIGANVDWGIELCSRLEVFAKTIRFGVNLRITSNAKFEELFKAFKKSNIKFVNIGLESGSPRVRREILKRNYSNNDIINAVEMARKYDIKVNFFVLIGIPSETLEDFNETVEVCRQCLPDGCYVSVFYPYEGTELYHLCKEQGLLNQEIDTNLERNIAVLDLPGFSKRQIQKSLLYFEYNVYKNHKPIYKIMATALRRKIWTSYHLNRLYRMLTLNKFFKRIETIMRIQ